MPRVLFHFADIVRKALFETPPLFPEEQGVLIFLLESLVFSVYIHCNSLFFLLSAGRIQPEGDGLSPPRGVFGKMSLLFLLESSCHLRDKTCNSSSSLLFFFLAITSSFLIRVLVFNSPYLGGMMAFLSRSFNFTEIIGLNLELPLLT